MSTSYSPQICTRGLELYLDAANTKSYPGSGITWYDLSGNNRDATKYGGTTFNSGGGFEFRNVSGDADYEYMTATVPTSTTGILDYGHETEAGTLEVGFRDMGLTTGNECFLVGRTGHHSGILANLGSSVVGQIRTTLGGTGQVNKSFGNITDNVGAHYVLTWNNRVCMMYKNGINVNTGTMGPSYYIRDHSDTLQIGGMAYNLYRAYGDISMVRAYSEELTATEVLQNYNATKGRVGF